jgi:hypothetical protein
LLHQEVEIKSLQTNAGVIRGSHIAGHTFPRRSRTMQTFLPWNKRATQQEALIHYLWPTFASGDALALKIRNFDLGL